MIFRLNPKRSGHYDIISPSWAVDARPPQAFINREPKTTRQIDEESTAQATRQIVSCWRTSWPGQSASTSPGRIFRFQVSGVCRYTGTETVRHGLLVFVPVTSRFCSSKQRLSTPSSVTYTSTSSTAYECSTATREPQ